MRTALARAYTVTAWVVVVGIFLQFAAAGLLVFRGVRTPHLVIGSLLPLLSLLALLLALAARLPRRALALNGALLGLMVGQHLILGFGHSLPWLLVLHIALPAALPIISLAAARQRPALAPAVAQPPGVRQPA